MAIWFDPQVSIPHLEQLGVGTMSQHLGIRFSEIGSDYLKATMPVDERTRQPYGLLHGGASVALAETLGSVASALVIDTQKWMCVGLEVNANHVRSVRAGLVTGIAKAIHIGNTTHVWDIKIFDEKERLLCVSRLTVAILKKKLPLGAA